MTTSFDAIVVGGGVMGAAAALQLAEGGMRVALCEARQLAMGASGVNAGTLSIVPPPRAPGPGTTGAAVWLGDLGAVFRKANVTPDKLHTVGQPSAGAPLRNPWPVA